VIDYYECIGSDIAVDVKAVLNKPYNYAKHIFPHDAWATQKQTGKTTIEFIEPLGSSQRLLSARLITVLKMDQQRRDVAASLLVRQKQMCPRH